MIRFGSTPSLIRVLEQPGFHAISLQSLIVRAVRPILSFSLLCRSARAVKNWVSLIYKGLKHQGRSPLSLPLMDNPSRPAKPAMKIMPKVDRHGQAAILSETDYARIRKALTLGWHKAFFDIARYTGERWGAICQLKVADVYDWRGQPHENITFRAATRKADPNGRRSTRQVPTHPALADLLRVYDIDRARGDRPLFPAAQNPRRPVQFSTVDKMLRTAIDRAGLDGRGISTHSTRRSFVTRLYENGADISTIQRLTGHKDLKSLCLYIEHDPDRAKAAIAML